MSEMAFSCYDGKGHGRVSCSSARGSGWGRAGSGPGEPRQLLTVTPGPGTGHRSTGSDMPAAPWPSSHHQDYSLVLADHIFAIHIGDYDRSASFPIYQLDIALKQASRPQTSKSQIVGDCVVQRSFTIL